LHPGKITVHSYCVIGLIDGMQGVYCYQFCFVVFILIEILVS